MGDLDSEHFDAPPGKSEIAARASAHRINAIGEVEETPESADLRRRGRPIVPDSARHRSIALSFAPDVAVMLKDDASENDLSASAYVARLIRAAHDSVRMRDPMEFYALLVVELNNRGAQVEMIGSRSFRLKDLARLPISSVQVENDLGTLWLDTATGDIDEGLRLYFQWVKVWDGSRYDRHFRRERDLTLLTEAAALEYIMAGGGQVMPDAF